MTNVTSVIALWGMGHSWGNNRCQLISEDGVDFSLNHAVEDAEHFFIILMKELVSKDLTIVTSFPSDILWQRITTHIGSLNARTYIPLLF
ncbi:MAG: hypothetical protein ACLRZG_07695 [Streptococcus sp.]